MKDGYKYYVMREEWQVVIHTLGSDELDTGATYSEAGSFPNRDAAERFRQCIAEPHSHLKDVWVPRFSNSDYQRVEIRCAAVRV